MQHKLIKLIVIFVVLFSFQGFSQVTEKSAHPLLDKYYPQKQNADTNKAVATQIKPVPETKSMQPATTTIVPPVTTTTAPPAITTPAITTTTVPGVDAKLTMTGTPAMATSTNISKPNAITAPAQKVLAQPAPPPYMDTRLGSSTKQFDTWEKNNNGAGSVTTAPK